MSKDEIFEQAQKAYAATEATTELWAPPDGRYPAHFIEFTQREKKTRDGVSYISFMTKFRLRSSPGSENLEGRETGEFFNSNPVTFKDQNGEQVTRYFGLRKLKSSAAILNDGVPLETIKEACDILEAAAGEELPVHIVVRRNPKRPEWPSVAIATVA